MPDVPNNKEGPQGREPSKCLTGGAMEKDWPRRPSDRRPSLLQRRQPMSLHMLCCPDPHKPSSCNTVMLNAHWGRDATGKKENLASRQTWSLRSCPTLCEPVDCGLPGFSVRGFSRREYWSVLANTACHNLLEQYISCCPSRQPP